MVYLYHQGKNTRKLRVGLSMAEMKYYRLVMLKSIKHDSFQIFCQILSVMKKASSLAISFDYISQIRVRL